ncbi:hypothetical protein GCM10027578_21220 [Spirosoma luteolum]
MLRSITTLTLLFVALLTACTDHRIAPGAPAARQRVKTIVLDKGDGITNVTSFSYDATGRLAGLIAYQTPDSTQAAVDYTTYQYDAQNRLAFVRRETRLFPRGSQPNSIEQYTYTYNQAGQATSLAYANGYTLAFRYDGAGQLTGAGRSFSTGGLIISGGDSYTFMGGNLTSYSTSVSVAGHGGPAGPPSGVSSTLTYDTKTNPFFGRFIIPAPYPSGFINLTFGPGAVVTYFGGVDNALTLSQNNVLTEILSNGQSVSYAYQYDGSGLPTRRVKTTPSTSGTTTETLLFSYETY